MSDSTPPQGGDYGSTPPPPPPSYGAPGQYGGPGQYGAPAYGMPTGTPPPNYLIWAILCTLFCCLPLGIASIVFAAQVNSKFNVGDYAGAEDASKKARQFALWGTIIGVVVDILLVVFFVLVVGVAATHSGTTY